MKFYFNTLFFLPKQSQRSSPSYKTDLDFWESFGRKKLRLIAEEICTVTVNDTLSFLLSFCMLLNKHSGLVDRSIIEL